MRRVTQSGSVEGELVQRAYTPVSQSATEGYLELLVKLYLPDQHYPTGGKMSWYEFTVDSPVLFINGYCSLFNELQIGDSLEMRGPLGSFTWIGGGVASWKGIKRKVRNVIMICGGSGKHISSPFLFLHGLSSSYTGITPIIQVLRGILLDGEDTDTAIWLLYANKTEDDIRTGFFA